MGAHRCAFVYGDGTREAFTIHDPAEGSDLCRVEGLAHSQSGTTPGVALTNTSDFLRWSHGREIAEVHAPARVLSQAAKHARRDPGTLAEITLDGRIVHRSARRSDFLRARLVPTEAA